MEITDTSDYKYRVLLLKEARERLKAAKRAVKRQEDIISYHERTIKMLEGMEERP
jgi:hypothetical protein